MSPSISARDAVTAGKGLCCLKAGGCASPGGFSEKSERPPRLARPTAIAHEPGEAGDTPRTPRHVSPPPRAVRTTMPRHLPPPPPRGDGRVSPTFSTSKKEALGTHHRCGEARGSLGIGNEAATRSWAPEGFLDK